MKLFCALFLTIFLFGTSYACETPNMVITDYLKYDYVGERLGSDVSVHIDKLTANPYEPAWDVMTLITGYEIQSIEQNKEKATVTVLFKKSWEISQKYQPESVKDEVVEINLEKIKGCWKVGPPFYQPHVSPLSSLKHLEKLLVEGNKEKMDTEYMNYTQSELDSVRQYKDANKPQ